jgi:hypothetical protein
MRFGYSLLTQRLVCSVSLLVTESCVSIFLNCVCVCMCVCVYIYIYMGGPGHNTVREFMKSIVYKKQSTHSQRTETRNFNGSNDQHL